MEWQWEEGSVLNKTSSYVATSDIFLAVCREVGRYFENSDGFKVSKRKVKWTGQMLRCEMAFWSSHYNMCGKYVCFDIVPSVYAKDKSGMVKNGLLPILSDHCARTFDVCRIDTDLFFKIIEAIEKQLEYVRYLDSKENYLKFVETRIPPKYRYNGEENTEILAERLKKRKE